MREELSRKVDEKNDKMAAIEEHRRSLMAELEKARKEISANDAMLKVRLRFWIRCKGNYR